MFNLCLLTQVHRNICATISKNFVDVQHLCIVCATIKGVGRSVRISLYEGCNPLVAKCMRA